jgi:hypothetical protein
VFYWITWSWQGAGRDGVLIRFLSLESRRVGFLTRSGRVLLECLHDLCLLFLYAGIGDGWGD